jgi:hypothetical protein
MDIAPKYRLFHLAALLAAATLAPLALAQAPGDSAPVAGAAAAVDDGTAPGLEIVVNIPAGELTVHEGGTFSRVYPITVGTRAHPTPIGEWTLTKAVWNPWWHPPKSRWARGKKPQPPGPENAMGRAKLYFKPLYFIHGTAETEKLGRPASHGCVRMSNVDVMDLARLVHRHANPDLDPAVLDALAADPKETKEIALERPVTLRIVYDRVELVGDELVVHPDVYRKVTRQALVDEVAAALAERGAVVDEKQVAEHIRDMHRDGGRIALAALVPGRSDLAAAVPAAE